MSGDLSGERSAEQAYQAICEGDGDAAAQWLQVAATPDDPWTQALSGAMAMTLGGAEVPTIEALQKAGSADSETLAHALEWSSLAALVRFDHEAILRLEEITAALPESPWRDLYAAERDLARGDLAEARDKLAVLQERETATVIGVRALCVDALAACRLGALDDATRCARLASRQSRLLRRRAYRYVAGLCLAQARRRSGRPHLAVRILSALDPLLPPAYRGWLALEQLGVGQAVHADLVETQSSPAAQQSRTLSALLSATRAGDRGRFDAARDGGQGEAVAVLAPLLDPDLPLDDAPEPLRPFLRGDEPSVPHGYELLAAALHDAPVAVYRPREGKPRRVVASGLLTERCTLVPSSRLHQGRTDLAAAVIALSPEPLTEEAFFRATFGLKLVPPMHEGVLAMTLSRVRKKLAGLADLQRGSGSITLVVHEPFAVADPRSAPPAEGAILRLVAQHGHITARGAAQTLGVSLRSVQAAVKQLVADGELQLDRAGRSISYRVDDTSFETPG